MIWLTNILLCITAWAACDLFYKAGTNIKDKNSHLKFLVWIGIINGIKVFCLLPLSESGLPLARLISENADHVLLILCYAAALAFGIFGTRYMEISVMSPLENVDGAIASLALVVIFLIRGTVSISDYSLLDLTGVIFVIIGIVYCGRIEQNREGSASAKHNLRAKVLFFPLVYTLFDAAAMIFDGIVLSEEGGAVLGEFDYLMLTGAVFFIVGIFSYLYLRYIKKEKYNPFQKSELPRLGGAATETVGNIFYAFAVSQNPVLTAPIVTSYCILTVFGARIFLKEKLNHKQYFCVAFLIIGIILIAVSELPGI